jgi:predicted TIM-barrel fold metal-dependent hydrolase
MSRRCGFHTFDADNHLYETKDAFTRHLPKPYQGAIKYVEVDGRTKIVVGGVISDYIPNPTFDVVARPGAQEEYFRDGNPHGKSYREVVGEPMRSIPAFREPEPRLTVMDEFGVDQTLMFPTLASLLEERMRDDAELAHVAVHAFNEWMYETWTFNYRDRIFATPVVTLPILDKAIAELEWCLERGAKTVLIRPAPVPVPGAPRSFAMPYFDPFWQKVVEADIPVAMHASDSGYARMMGEWTGPTEYLPFTLEPFTMMILSHRPALDAAASMTCHGLLSRFPDLRIVFVENGGEWVAPLFRDLRQTYERMPQLFLEDPVEAFKRNCWISPFHEDDFDELIEAVGADHLVFGSDWPHPEGLADPCTFVDHLPESLSQREIAQIMGGNLSRVTNVGVPV